MPREKETPQIPSLGNGDKSSVPLDSAGTRERPEMPIAAPSTCRQAAENVPPGIFSEELRKMAARAKFNRYIPIEALIRILAQEEDYTKVYAEALPVLWSNYGLDAIWRKKGKKELEIVTFGNRYEIWEGVLLRWAGISISGGSSQSIHQNSISAICSKSISNPAEASVATSASNASISPASTPRSQHAGARIIPAPA